MMGRITFLIVAIITSGACSKSQDLHQFGKIWVSDPRIEGTELKVEIVNNTGEELCYFEDGLFYGRNAIEGSTGQTEIRTGAPASSLEEIKYSSTGRADYSIRRIEEGRGEISIKISGQYPLAIGDDITFDIIFCDVEDGARYKTLDYQSRLG